MGGCKSQYFFSLESFPLYGILVIFLQSGARTMQYHLTCVIKFTPVIEASRLVTIEVKDWSQTPSLPVIEALIVDCASKRINTGNNWIHQLHVVKRQRSALTDLDPTIIVPISCYVCAN